MLKNCHGYTFCAVAVMTIVFAAQPVGAEERFRLDDGQWKAQARIDPASAEGQLQTIRKTLAQGQAKIAYKAIDQWIEDHSNHDLLVEAYLIRGDTWVTRRRYFKALFDYEYVVRMYPASEQFITACDREYEIAKIFASGMKRVWLGMRVLPAAGEAEELYIRIQERLPGSDLGEKASLSLGDFYFDRREMTSASAAYDLFLQNYPHSEYRERAMLRLIHASLATFKGSQFDSTGLIDAQVRINQFEAEYPASAERIGVDSLKSKINELLALKHEQIGSWYQRQGNRVSASYMYQRVIKDYSDTAAAQAAANQLHTNQQRQAAPDQGQDAAEQSPENAS